MFKAFQARSDEHNFGLLLAFSEISFQLTFNRTLHNFESNFEEEKFTRTLSHKLYEYMKQEELWNNLQKMLEEKKNQLDQEWKTKKSFLREELKNLPMSEQKKKKKIIIQVHKEVERPKILYRLIVRNIGNKSTTLFSRATLQNMSKYIKQFPETNFSLFCQSILRCMFKHLIHFLNKESPELLENLEKAQKIWFSSAGTETEEEKEGARNFKRQLQIVTSYCLRCGKKKPGAKEYINNLDSVKKLYIKGYDKDSPLSLSVSEASLSPYLSFLAQHSTSSKSNPVELKFTYEVLTCVVQYLRTYENNPDLIDLDYFSIKKTLKSELLKESLFIKKKKGLRRKVYRAAQYLNIQWLMDLMTEENLADTESQKAE